MPQTLIFGGTDLLDNSRDFTEIGRRKSDRNQNSCTKKLFFGDAPMLVHWTPRSVHHQNQAPSYIQGQQEVARILYKV
jgi:hypothetical protein